MIWNDAIKIHPGFGKAITIPIFKKSVITVEIYLCPG